MNEHQKLIISSNRLLGEFIGTLKGVCAWDIPKKLKSNLEEKIKQLEKVKIDNL